ncbi:MAG: hypothetical protein AB2L24_23165 [Mangrovibacterium sp.]
MKKHPIGGLVDGPIYRSTFGNLKGVHLSQEDPYAPFQSYVVYHDDHADYSTNEPHNGWYGFAVLYIVFAGC